MPGTSQGWSEMEADGATLVRHASCFRLDAPGAKTNAPQTSAQATKNCRCLNINLSQKINERYGVRKGKTPSMQGPSLS
jgi:hypothetical protein